MIIKYAAPVPFQDKPRRGGIIFSTILKQNNTTPSGFILGKTLRFPFSIIMSPLRGFQGTVKLFIFVRDLIHLPKKLENEFEVNQFSLVFPNEQTMIITQGTKNFTEKLYEHVFGYNPAEVLAKERQKAELEFQKKAEIERQKADQERQLLLTQTIHNLHQLAQMDVPQIALMMGISEVEVQEVLNTETPSQEG